ncbi:MAG: TatD family hydrolase [Lachnospiraceae bacterium]|nr:TatD family hydrolase [Lachnospiraceae bacterium]
MIFDTHIHWDDERFDEDRDALIAGLPAAGIGCTVNAGCSVASTEAGLALAARYPHVFMLAGIHPHDAAGTTDADLARIEEFAHAEKCVGVGEIGLDRHWPDADKEAQERVFLAQLDIAKRLKMPVAIHSRDASEDTLRIMQTEGRDLGGVIHCYSYSKETAEKYLEMGYFLGIGGVITYKNGRKLAEVVGYAPIEQLVLETDAPYLSPEPFRGKRNSSYQLPLVVKKIAEIKGLTEREVEDITWANACRMYRLSEDASCVMRGD